MMIEFLSGAVTLGFVVAAMFFVHFWRRTRDRLFLAFGGAFSLLAVNQAAAHFLFVANEPASVVYVLRVLAFAIIIAAIVDKNRPSSRASLSSSGRRK